MLQEKQRCRFWLGCVVESREAEGVLRWNAERQIVFLRQVTLDEAVDLRVAMEQLTLAPAGEQPQMNGKHSSKSKSRSKSKTNSGKSKHSNSGSGSDDDSSEADDEMTSESRSARSNRRKSPTAANSLNAVAPRMTVSKSRALHS